MVQRPFLLLKVLIGIHCWPKWSDSFLAIKK